MTDSVLGVVGALPRYDDEVRRRIAEVAEVPRRLYHYTDIAGAQAIIESHSLWATHPDYLNDAAELHYARDRLLEVAQSERGRNGHSADDPDYLDAVQTARHVFHEATGLVANFRLASFSAVVDRSGMWAQYARVPNIGYALQFDTRGMREGEWYARDVSPTGPAIMYHGPGVTRLLPVLYDREQQLEILHFVWSAYLAWGMPMLADARQPDLNRRAWPTVTGREQALLIECLDVLPAMMKHPTFADEQEWRLVTSFAAARPKLRVTPYGLAPYVTLAHPGGDGRDGRLPLSGVVQGPTAHQTSGREGMRHCLRGAGYSADVWAADITLR